MPENEPIPDTDAHLPSTRTHHLPEETIVDIFRLIHRDLVEWMEEGTHPNMAPRSDYG